MLFSRKNNLDIFKELGKNTPDSALFYLLYIGALCFSMYYLLSKSDYLKSKLTLKFGYQDQIPWFIFSKSFGFILMGIIPAFLLVSVLHKYSLQDFGFYAGKISRNAWNWFWILSIGFIFINAIIGRTAEVQKKHPQIRVTHWKPFHFLLMFFGWGIYIVAYEFFFRGLLFFPLVESFGIWPAIGVNVFIYGLAHLNQGAGETIAAIVFGVFFCLATLETGSIWVAAASHLVFSLSGNLAAFYFNPEMKISRN